MSADITKETAEPYVAEHLCDGRGRPGRPPLAAEDLAALTLTVAYALGRSS